MSRIFTRSKMDKLVAVFIAAGLIVLAVFLPQLRGANGATLISPLPTDSPLPTPTPTPTPTPLPSPTISDITPTHGSTRVAARLTITGANFIATPVVAIGLTRLINIEFVSSSVVRATIPTGMTPGVYTLRLCNPNLKCAEKTNAYTVEAIWPPVLAQIVPGSGPGNMPNDVTIFGRDMQPGIQISIGNTLLQNITWLNPMIVQAVAPSGLSAGTHDVTARNPSTNEPSILSNAYSVIDPHSNDFFAGPDDLWMWPFTIHEGDTAQLGLVVHRDSDTTSTSQQAQVSFYAGDPDNGGTLLHTATTPPIPPGMGNLDIASFDWNTTGYSLTVNIYAVIVPDGLPTESNKLNNKVMRAITILPNLRDNLPPRVVSMTLNGGAKVTYSPLITLTLIATDTGGSGVQNMYMVDRMYNAAAHQWVAVQSSGWIPYQETFTMTLINRGGVHYVQAWVADGQGNISLNFAMRRIDYIREGEHIRAGDIHLYQRELAQGERFTVHLDSLSGDADLYVWGPAGFSRASLNSDQIDEVTFIAPESGAYSIEVYGYLDSVYNLEMSSGDTAGMQIAIAGAPTKPSLDKTPRTAPVTAPESTPINEVAVPSAPAVFKAFIPVAQLPAAPSVFKTFLPFVGNNPGVMHKTFIPIVSNGTDQ